MTVTINGTTGITNDGGYTGDGIVFADTTPSNTLVTTTGGNVGVGTSSPAAKLTINQGSVGTYFRANASTADRPLTLTSSTTTNNGDTHTLNIDSGTGIFAVATNGSERARIDTSGNLLVGTTSTPVSGYNCFSESGADVQLILQRTGGGDGYGGIGGSGSYALSVYGSSGGLAQRFYVTQGGATYNTTGTYGTFSDIKVKENIQDARDYLEDLCKVRIVKYSLKADAKSAPDKLGVIAQELEQIFPNMIEEQPDVVNGKEILDTTTKTVKYSVFVPMLVKAIQEQQAIITALTARVEALEGTQP